MSKSFRPGHSFPTSAGFTGSSGKVATIGGYTRRMPRAALSTAPKGKFARATPPKPGTPRPKPKLAAPMVDPGSALQRPASRKISQQDVISGAKTALLPGYKRGGMAKKC